MLNIDRNDLIEFFKATVKIKSIKLDNDGFEVEYDFSGIGENPIELSFPEYDKAMELVDQLILENKQMLESMK